jgi:hypothetical protein
MFKIGMGFLFWRRKKEERERYKGLEESVELIKKEFSKASEWIKHLHSRDCNHKEKFEEMDARIDSIEQDIAEIKDLLSFFGPKLFKHRQTAPTYVYEQPHIQNVQTYVRTRNKSDILRNLTTMERAIIWVLLNTDMKLSYEDIAAILGKNRATIRGQVNSIKQKSEYLIEEIIEKTGKKRVFITQETKERLLKAMNVEKKSKKRKVREEKFG